VINGAVSSMYNGIIKDAQGSIALSSAHNNTKNNTTLYIEDCFVTKTIKLMAGMNNHPW
jgi:hypothetical protein